MVLPGSNFSGPWNGIVTALEPDYDGRCVMVFGLSRRRAQVEAEDKALAQVRISGWTVGETFSKRCADCGKERQYAIKEVNRTGTADADRITSVRLRRSEAGCRTRLCRELSALHGRPLAVESVIVPARSF
jgi:hypothetical protein